ncbi:MAG: TOBE domain-containing protein, partial [Rhizobiales bacterium]|nr:TOBE domain-containing protein [Hyphomicrobiales bacterium]
IRPEAVATTAGAGRLTLAEAHVEEIVLSRAAFKRVRARAKGGQPILLKAPVDVAIDQDETVSLHVRADDLILLTR